MNPTTNTSGAPRHRLPFLPALVGWAIFLGAAEAFTIGLSLGRVVISQPVALGILLVAAGLGLLAGRALRRATPGANGSPTSPSPLLRLMLGVAGLALAVYVLLWPMALLTPEQTFDGNAYHRPAIHLWALRGYVHWVTPPVQDWGTSNFLDNGEIILNGFPKGVEVVGFLAFRATGSARWVATANLWFLPLAVLGIGYLATALGCSTQAALFAGAAFVLIPAALVLSVTTYCDPGYAAAVIALVALTAWAARTIRGAEGGPWLLPGIALGAAMGLSMGGKGTGLAAALLSVVVLAVCAAFRTHAPRGRKGKDGPDIRRAGEGARGWSALLRLAVPALLVTLLVGGYWPLRNWAHTGNPLYPARVKVGPLTIVPGYDPTYFLGTEFHTPLRVRALPEPVRFVYAWLQGLGEWPSEVKLYDSRLTGLGWIWLVGCLPAVVHVLLGRKRRLAGEQQLVLWIILGIVVPLFVVTPTNWWARLVVWIMGLGLPCLGLALDQAAGSAARLVRVWAVLCLLVMVLDSSVALAETAGRMFPGGQVPPPPAWLRAETWRWNLAPFFPESAGTRLDEVLRSDAPVIIGPLGRVEAHRGRVQMLGVLCYPLGRRVLLSVGLEPTGAELRALRAQGAQWLIWDDDLPLPETVRAAAVTEDHIPSFWVVRLR